MRTIIKRLSFSVLLSICAFWGPLAQEILAGPGELTGYFTVQSFDWKEFAEGSRAVRETGPLFGIGIEYPVHLGERVTAKPSAEIFGGSVDYDGHACDIFGDDCEAAETTVSYFGVQLQGDVGRRLPAGSASLEPFAGLGFRYWRRNIDEGTTVTGTPVSGFTEDWVSLYARAGLEVGVDLSERRRLFFLAGAKLPFFTQNTAYTSSLGQGDDLELRPGKQVSFFGEAGVELDRFSVSLLYDSFRFPQSPTVFNGFTAGYQPRSTMDLYGLKLGWTF
jgi:hypothetical protein